MPLRNQLVNPRYRLQYSNSWQFTSLAPRQPARRMHTAPYTRCRVACNSGPANAQRRFEKSFKSDKVRRCNRLLAVVPTRIVHRNATDNLLTYHVCASTMQFLGTQRTTKRSIGHGIFHRNCCAVRERIVRSKKFVDSMRSPSNCGSCSRDLVTILGRSLLLFSTKHFPPFIAESAAIHTCTRQRAVSILVHAYPGKGWKCVPQNEKRERCLGGKRTGRKSGTRPAFLKGRSVYRVCGFPLGVPTESHQGQFQSSLSS